MAAVVSCSTSWLVYARRAVLLLVEGDYLFMLGSHLGKRNLDAEHKTGMLFNNIISIDLFHLRNR